MNTNIRRKTRRKQRAHQRARKTRNPNDWAYYKALQTEVQKETRIAHRNYVQEVVSNYFNEKPKRFWSYVKSKSWVLTSAFLWEVVVILRGVYRVKLII
jgi:hypothetical protein